MVQHRPNAASGGLQVTVLGFAGGPVHSGTNLEHNGGPSKASAKHWFPHRGSKVRAYNPGFESPSRTPKPGGVVVRHLATRL